MANPTKTTQHDTTVVDIILVSMMALCAISFVILLGIF